MLAQVRFGPLMLKHLGAVPTFAVEGHAYEADDGQRFFVFTAGNGQAWDAAVDLEGARVDGREGSSRRFGATVVRGAPSRVDCVRELLNVVDGRRGR